jgi:DNA-binding PadR family transcriptional regulator
MQSGTYTSKQDLLGMSYYKGKHGDRIRKYWHASEGNKDALRDWMQTNGLNDVSITVFCRLEQHQEKRVSFVNRLKKKAYKKTG